MSHAWLHAAAAVDDDDLLERHVEPLLQGDVSHWTAGSHEQPGTPSCSMSHDRVMAPFPRIDLDQRGAPLPAPALPPDDPSRLHP